MLTACGKPSGVCCQDLQETDRPNKGALRTGLCGHTSWDCPLALRHSGCSGCFHCLLGILFTGKFPLFFIAGACQASPAPSETPISPQTTPAPASVLSLPPPPTPTTPGPAKSTAISREFAQTLACHFGRACITLS